MHSVCLKRVKRYFRHILRKDADIPGAFDGGRESRSTET